MPLDKFPDIISDAHPHANFDAVVDAANRLQNAATELAGNIQKIEDELQKSIRAELAGGSGLNQAVLAQRIAIKWDTLKAEDQQAGNQLKVAQNNFMQALSDWQQTAELVDLPTNHALNTWVKQAKDAYDTMWPANEEQRHAHPLVQEVIKNIKKEARKTGMLSAFKQSLGSIKSTENTSPSHRNRNKHKN